MFFIIFLVVYERINSRFPFEGNTGLILSVQFGGDGSVYQRWAYLSSGVRHGYMGVQRGASRASIFFPAHPFFVYYGLILFVLGSTYGFV